MTDENPYRSPETYPLPVEKTSEQKDKLRNNGCLVLFLLALPLVDAFGVAMSCAGPYCSWVFMAGSIAFICGAGLGDYVSVRTLRQPWWSSCRWAIYGLIGMGVPSILFVLWSRGR